MLGMMLPISRLPTAEQTAANGAEPRSAFIGCSQESRLKGLNRMWVKFLNSLRNRILACHLVNIYTISEDVKEAPRRQAGCLVRNMSADS